MIERTNLWIREIAQNMWGGSLCSREKFQILHQVNGSYWKGNLLKRRDNQPAGMEAYESPLQIKMPVQAPKHKEPTMN